jgi:hypothetical protein
MKGLRIGRNYKGPTLRSTDPEVIRQEKSKNPTILVISDGLSDFYRYFSIILPELSNYSWVFEEDCLSMEEKRWNELDKLILEKKDQYKYAKPGFIQKFANFIHDDWCNIFGFTSPIDNLDNFIKKYWASKNDRNKFLSQTVDIYFVNIDAAFWEVYSKNENLLTIVSSEVKKDKDYYVNDCNLMEKKV